MDVLASGDLMSSDVIPWSSPIVSFGDAGRATVATVGLNPSNREFVNQDGEELAGASRRFETLASLRLKGWRSARASHVERVVDSCRGYFQNNPYDRWFGRLEFLFAGKVSYYDRHAVACHLDISPFATARKWGDLLPCQQRGLVATTGHALGLVLRESRISLLILNGQGVRRFFELGSTSGLTASPARGWTLSRRNGREVPGYWYEGEVESFGGVPLGRGVRVVGFNHNIQSSFGVTRQALHAIRLRVRRELDRRSLYG